MKRSLRIVEVAHNLPAEVFITRHVQALQASSRLDVKLVARHNSSHYSQSASVQPGSVDALVRVIPNFDHLPVLGKLGSLHYLPGSPRDWFARRPLRDKVLLAFFRSFKPDLLHFHSSTLAAAMGWIATELGIPYTISLRGSDIQVDPLRSERARASIKKALLEADGIHTVCGALGDIARQVSENSSLGYHTIYTTVPFQKHLPAYCPEDGGIIRLISVGRLHWTKSCPDLLCAIKAMREAGENVHLTIVGSGPEERRILGWVKDLAVDDSVSLAGKKSGVEIQRLLQVSHAYVQSSIAEGLSNALVESMAGGCPVFATSVGGTGEIIEDGVNGFLLEPLHPEAWVEKLLKVKDRQLMKTVRERAYLSAIEKFSPQAHASRFEEFYGTAARRQPWTKNKDLQKNKNDTLNGTPWGSRQTGGPIIQVSGPWEWDTKVDWLVRGIAGQKEDRTRCGWVIAGNGPLADELKYLVFFLGLSDRVYLLEGNEENGGPGHENRTGQPPVGCLSISSNQWVLTIKNCVTEIHKGDVSTLLNMVENWMDRVSI